MSTVVVAGGAGFIGSHICDALVARGDSVIAIDNLVTGRRANVAHLVDHPQFLLVEHDVCQLLALDGPIHAVLDLASPASPVDFATLAIEILEVGSSGTRNLLIMARDHGARFLLASTSEVYGDPLLHPQPESYWGNVNPIGPRSCYDEAKRFSEAITMAFHRTHGVDVRIARIFNTYGPRMRPDDGRVVTNFLGQALTGVPLTVYGDGKQTRSFCYVDDEVRGLLALLDGAVIGPVNIGNPTEFTMLELAEAVLDVTASRSAVTFAPLPTDDPTQRRPDITMARERLGWEPSVDLRDGLTRMAAWLRTVI